MNVAHLNALRALEASLRCGSFRAASVELRVTPAAVGQQIRVLEDYLGHKLFLRTTKGATPTADAEAVADRLTASLSAIEGVLEQLSRRKQPNRIAITLPASFAENWFTRHIAEFYQQHSEIDLRLDASKLRLRRPVRGQGHSRLFASLCKEAPPGSEAEEPRRGSPCPTWTSDT
jgi:LysR family glycine cleavage system transcriptional activator